MTISGLDLGTVMTYGLLELDGVDYVVQVTRTESTSVPGSVDVDG